MICNRVLWHHHHHYCYSYIGLWRLYRGWECTIFLYRSSRRLERAFNCLFSYTSSNFDRASASLTVALTADGGLESGGCRAPNSRSIRLRRKSGNDKPGRRGSAGQWESRVMYCFRRADCYFPRSSIYAGQASQCKECSHQCHCSVLPPLGSGD